MGIRGSTSGDHIMMVAVSGSDVMCSFSTLSAVTVTIVA